MVRCALTLFAVVLDSEACDDATEPSEAAPGAQAPRGIASMTIVSGSADSRADRFFDSLARVEG